MARAKKRVQPNKLGLFILVNIVILFFLLLGFGREYVSNIQIEQEIASQVEKRQSLESQQLDTLALIDQFSSEYHLESEGRETYGLGREGEVMVVIQDLEVDDELTSEQEVGGVFDNPARWFYYFFDSATFAAIQEEL